MSQQQVLDQLTSAYTEDFKYHQDGVWMARWYASRVLAEMHRRQARTLLSLGIGEKTVPKTIVGRHNMLDRYVIVEGSADLASELAGELGPQPHLEVVNALFEDFDPAERFDAVEMGFVLEHVDEPEAIVRQYLPFLKPGGVMFVAVPNARSLHRLVGQAAGLLDDLYRLSEYDLQLGHKRFFDLNSLTGLLAGCGARIARAEGIFLKPITLQQFNTLDFAPEVLQAFFTVGVERPDICNAIYVECTV